MRLKGEERGLSEMRVVLRMVLIRDRYLWSVHAPNMELEHNWSSSTNLGGVSVRLQWVRYKGNVYQQSLSDQRFPIPGDYVTKAKHETTHFGNNHPNRVGQFVRD